MVKENPKYKYESKNLLELLQRREISRGGYNNRVRQALANKVYGIFPGARRVPTSNTGNRGSAIRAFIPNNPSAAYRMFAPITYQTSRGTTARVRRLTPNQPTSD